MSFFKSLCLLTLCSAISSSGVASTRVALKSAFEGAFLVGSATNAAIDSGRDAATQGVVLEQFNTITVENELKAGTLSPAPGVYDFTAGDQFVAFGEANDMFIVGHTLVWHNQTPEWFSKTNRAAQIPRTNRSKLCGHTLKTWPDDMRAASMLGTSSMK